MDVEELDQVRRIADGSIVEITDGVDVFSQSQYIWIETDEEPFAPSLVSFYQDFDYTSEELVYLNLFADTRYRIWLNDVFVGTGPGRFVTDFPEFDRYELSSSLKERGNRLRVEVYFYGVRSYQTMPDGRPVFIASGGDESGTIDFATPGPWRAMNHEAWDKNAPNFSFAQNMVEICDCRLLQDELNINCHKDSLIRVCGEEQTRELSPRSVPHPTYDSIEPKWLTAVGEPESSMQVYGWHTHRPEADLNAKWQSFITWIWTPESRTIRLSALWGELFCNGEAIRPDYDHSLGNHQSCSIRLKSGWNSLYGGFELVEESWTVMLGLRDGEGLQLSAYPRFDCSDRFLLSPARREPEVLTSLLISEPERIPCDWFLDSGDVRRVTPSRRMAWCRPASELKERLTYDEVGAIQMADCQSQYLWAFDFERQFTGHLELEIEAPRGSIIDVAYDDWLRSDGCVSLYVSNPFVHTVDRYIAAGGRQVIHGLNPRGGRYLQVMVDCPSSCSDASVRIHSIRMVLHSTLQLNRSQFKCGIPQIDWAWEASRRTLESSASETYNDCPWRERGSYLEDGYISLKMHACLSPDLSVGRRMLQLFGQAQRADGQFPCCAPAWLLQVYDDFSLTWALALWEYYLQSGDRAFLISHLPHLEKLLDSGHWQFSDNGLLNAKEKHLFIDWGVLREDREGRGNAYLSILYCSVCRTVTEIFEHLDQTGRAIKYTERADSIEKSLMESLWLSDLGAFASSNDLTSPSLHANALAFVHGIGDPDQLLNFIRPKLLVNAEHGFGQGEHSGYFELAFLDKLLPALAEAGKPELAEQLICEHYGWLKEKGFLTLPESMFAASTRNGSACHSWSGGALTYASRYILGLRRLPGTSDGRWLFDPIASEGIDRANGVVACCGGYVSIDWKRADGRIVAEISAPDLIEIECGNSVTMRRTKPAL